MLERIEHRACFGGWQDVYRHRSRAVDGEMRFAIYLPPQAEDQRVPVLYWLSGLTCTEQNFITKSGAQRYAAEHGIALVVCDTSPRGENVADDAAYDLGQGAGFYLNATVAPWSQHYRMYDYVTQRTAGMDRRAFSRYEQALDQRPFHGRSWCVDHCAEKSRTLLQRVGVLAHRCAIACAMGRKSVFDLSGQRS